MTKLNQVVPNFFLQSELEVVNNQLEEHEHKASVLGKQCATLESQLADAQETVQDETRQKLQLQTRVRQAEEKADSLQDALEEEEEAKRALETKNNALQVIDFPNISAFLDFLM